MTMTSFHRGQFGPTHDIGLLGVDDVLGTLRGYRIFTTVRTVAGQLLDQDAHLNRLFNAAEFIQMSVGNAIHELRDAIPTLLQTNQCHKQDVVMQLFLSGGGVQPTGMSALDAAWPSILVREYHPVSDDLLQNGFKLATMAHERAFAPVKFTFYASSVIAHHTVVKQHQADDVLFLTCGNNPMILEGSTFNVFVVQNGTIMTPRADDRILAGITRRRILEWVDGVETDILWSDRGEWDEMFLCSSVRGAVGVTMVDGKPIGDGKVGPITKEVMITMNKALNRLMHDGCYYP